jgi:hypothetical protein
MSQAGQEETSRAWLDHACVATVDVLRDGADERRP